MTPARPPEPEDDRQETDRRVVLSLVVAMDDNRLIGSGGKLPWRLPDDMRHFKALTIGKTVLMGRKTWESLGKPLVDRRNWVLTRDPGYRAPGGQVFTDLRSALSAHGPGELMVIGGAEIYRITLPMAHRIHLTEVHARLDGDTWFPPLEPRRWHETARDDRAADERHAHPFSFVTLERA